MRSTTTTCCCSRTKSPKRSTCSPSCSSAAGRSASAHPGQQHRLLRPARIHVAHDHQRAGALGRVHGGREQSRARGRRQDQGLPVPAGRSLWRRQIARTPRSPTRWRRLVPTTTRPRPHAAGRFCGSCYYWNVCRGGCTWVTHGLAAARRQPILLLSRARVGEEGAARAHREGRGGARRAVRLRTFDIVVEDANGRRVPGALARDDKKRPRGRKLKLCTGCREFIFASERTCPHCGVAHRPERKPPAAASSEPAVHALVDEIDARMRGAFTSLSTDRRRRPARGPHRPAQPIREESMASPQRSSLF